MLNLMYSILDTLSPNFTVVCTFVRVSQTCKDAHVAYTVHSARATRHGSIRSVTPMYNSKNTLHI